MHQTSGSCLIHPPMAQQLQHVPLSFSSIVTMATLHVQRGGLLLSIEGFSISGKPTLPVASSLALQTARLLRCCGSHYGSSIKGG